MSGAFPAVVFAATGAPTIMNYQGRLMQPDGTLLGGGGTDYCFKFSFYDDSVVGGGDNKLWPTGTPSTMTVVVKSGVFNVGIGDTVAGGDTLDYNFQDSDAVYLNVEVADKVGATCAAGDGAETYETLSPRQRIFSSGYAINSNTVGGRTAAQLIAAGFSTTSADHYAHSSSTLVKTYANNTFTGTNIFTGTASTSDLVVSNGFTFGTISGILKSTLGVIAAALVDLANDVTGILPIGNGGTGTSTTPTFGKLLVGNALGGYDLIATSSLGINSGIWGSITGNIADQTDLYDAFDSHIHSSSTIPKTYTGNTFTSLQTFSGGIAGTSFALTGSATSTADNGIDLSDGCFSVNGSCIGAGGGGGSGVLIGIQTFTSGGTYTPTAGATNAQVIVTGAGGGGGGADGPAADTTNETVAGGGGAGGTSIAAVDLTGITSVTVIVGTGGGGGSNAGGNGSTGGDSAFGTHATGTGGVFGGGTGATNATGCAAAGAMGTPGAGGTANTGDVNITGGTGFSGSCLAEIVNGGSGGSSYWGGGGRGSIDPVGNGCSAGVAASAYGSGGGGASCEDSDVGATGGTGAGGIVVVYEYGPFNGIMSIANGGTGVAYSPTYGQMLMGDGSGGYTLVATSTLGIAAGGSSFSTTSAEYFVHSSTTIPKTYTANTFTALQTITNASTTNITASYASSTQGFFGSLSLGSLSGILKATAGAVSNALVNLTSDVTGILGIANGGTGTSTAPTYGKLLVGNALGGYDLIATSSLGINAGVWGNITGTLSDQTDLQSALDAKLALSDWYATTTDGLAQGSTNKYYSSLLFAGDLAGTTTDALAEGSSRLYFTNGRVQTFLDTVSKGYFFATSSADFWKTQNNFFATTSADHWLTQQTTDNLAQGATNKYYSSLLFAGDLAATTTDALAEGATNKYFSNALVGAYISGSSTIPHVGGTAFGDMLSWTGSAWAIHATSTLGISLDDTTGALVESQGGTGQVSYTLGDILYSSAPGELSRLPIGAPGQVLKVTGGIPAWGVDQTTGGGGGGGGIFSTTTDGRIVYPSDTSHIVTIGTNATSTDNTIFEVSGRSYFSNNLWVATTSSPGSLLSLGDIADFKTGGSIFYSGVSVPSLTASGAVSASSLTIGSLSGILKATAGAISTALVDLTSDVTGILGVANGGTGTSTTPTFGKLLVGNAAGGYDLVATSSLGINSGVWGSITGTLSDQTDLQSALDAKLALSDWYATTTDGLAEGSTNKYFSNALVGAYISGSSTIPHIGGSAFGDMLSWTGSAWATRATSTLSLKTVDLVEESNLFWTNDRFDNRLSATTTLPSLTTLANLATVGTITSGTFSSAISGATINSTAIGATTASTAVFTNATTTNATSTNLAVSGNTTLAQATSTTMAVTSISNGLVAANGSGSLITASIGSSLSFSGNSLSLNLSNPNLWTGLQTFGNASTTAVSALDYMTVGRTATTTIRGEANATSTFAGGVDASRVNATATSTMSGLRIGSGGLQIATITDCTQALETDASGNVVCGTDGGIDGVTVTTFTAGGTWTKANYTGLSFTQVITTAAGGGGGGVGGAAADTTTEHSGGGGGAGATAIEMIAAGSLGTTETVTVGGGGTAGTPGTIGGTGGASSFGSHHSAVGGTGGGSPGANGTACAAATVGAGGAGGTASSGDVNIAGGAGMNGTCLAEVATGGDGGASYWGGGGAGRKDTQGNAGGTGNDANAFGAGGGGASEEDSGVTSYAGGAGAGGVVVTMNYTSSGGDLAEWYETKDDVEAGDVVAISQDSYEYDSKLGLQRSSILEKASAGGSVVGVVSTAPYETIGYDVLAKAKHPRPIALAGRVPVKVSEENGVIKAGDLLTLSSKSGVAMRSTKAGVTIGRALEDAVCVEGEDCQVLVMVNTGYSNGALISVALRDSGLVSDAIPGEVDVERDVARAILAEMIQNKKDIIASSTLSEINTDRIAAGLEIISPRVVADTLVVNTIEPAQTDVRVKITDDGRFVIERVGQDDLSVTFDAASTTAPAFAVSIDALGNALFAGALTAANFEVGSAEHPGGITMYDTATGEPYCTQIAGGKLKTVVGKCGEGSTVLFSSDDGDVSEGGVSTTERSSPPVIIIQGNNPAYIDVGSTYADLGASVTDDHDNNLGIHTYVNGTEVQEVSLDTSAPATYTIHYRVTDTDGNISEEHRVVVVGDGEVVEEAVEPSEEAAPAEASTPESTPQTTEVQSVQEEQAPASDPLPAPAAASEPEAQIVPVEAVPTESTPVSESETQ